MKKETGFVDWEHIEFLFRDKEYQHALQILKECRAYESKILMSVGKQKQQEQQLKDIFVKYYKQYTTQDIVKKSIN